ncbi:hypothetical protein [Sphingobium boeckii]|uniref:DUF1761 domain-containing protein n=1 Tax=Sphingobium boeckii TaxID=1082345 RepID=A0A7W9AF85_9SPHN|nr:hypothetical protein [Sphingobium boeckii]MBB5684384.1 hypothetical protein [Sphingobium boeckii]
MNARIIRNAILIAIAATILTIIALVIWLAIYAAAIDPGHQLAFYGAYATDNGAKLGLIVSVPIFLGAGWLIGRSASTKIDGAKRGALVAGIYILIDLVPAVLFRGAEQTDAQPLITGYVAVMVSAVIGGWLAAGRSTTVEPTP